MIERKKLISNKVRVSKELCAHPISQAHTPKNNESLVQFVQYFDSKKTQYSSILGDYERFLNIKFQKSNFKEIPKKPLQKFDIIILLKLLHKLQSDKFLGKIDKNSTKVSFKTLDELIEFLNYRKDSYYKFRVLEALDKLFAITLLVNSPKVNQIKRILTKFSFPKDENDLEYVFEINFDPTILEECDSLYNLISIPEIEKINSEIVLNLYLFLKNWENSVSLGNIQITALNKDKGLVRNMIQFCCLLGINTDNIPLYELRKTLKATIEDLNKIRDIENQLYIKFDEENILLWTDDTAFLSAQN